MNRDRIFAAASAVLLIALLTPYARLGIDFHHDGIMLKPALDVLSGQVLFRDTFNQYGALTTYLQVVALWISPTLLSLKYFTVAVYAVTLFTFYLAWRTFLPQSLALAAVATFFLFFPCYELQWWKIDFILLPWSSVYAMMFQSFGMLGLVRMIEHRRPLVWAGVLGASCAATFWCRFPVGFTMTGSVVVIAACLAWTGWKPASTTPARLWRAGLIGFVIVNALLLASVVLPGATAEWWYQNFVWPRKWVGADGGASPVYWRVFFPPNDQLITLLVLTTLLAGSAFAFRRGTPGGRRAAAVGLFTALGLVVWQWRGVVELFSLRQGTWIVLVPLAIVLQALSDAGRCFAQRPVASEHHLAAAAGGFAVASLAQLYPIADPWHALWALGPGFGLFAYAIGKTAGGRAPVVASVLVLLLLPAAYTRWQDARMFLAKPRVELQRPAVLRGLLVHPKDARFYDAIMAALDKAVAIRPNLTATMIGKNATPLCFMPNLENPTPFYVTWPLLLTPESEAQRWAYIEKVRPLVFAEKANWEFINKFYERERYGPLLYYHEAAFEIGAPLELLQAAGVPRGGIPIPASP